jgi:hypothetical protein
MDESRGALGVIVEVDARDICPASLSNLHMGKHLDGA